ncbi:mitochondrial chaperone bcs1 [Stemphylium lycopersici]|uniref:Mitochondrial chaperone bcs1 n=1 Tax=Stemphylium lycopersici TaxID=183478 RepID=A0A364NA80_STELY|nr:mitochondrial chaperone bcs1 [Stemphylium lycopersici]RAR09561.1 mitochondrial chaperone bcs1 [Stemphylium lycopersici]RAR14229.1 mitochondrial chaperone bcs1 [Stemphylium lycopersici]
MEQGSILPFLKKPGSHQPGTSRSGNSRPGQPYHRRPNPDARSKQSSTHNSKHYSTNKHRGPNRRRNTDLEKVADETKAELPKILGHLHGFHPDEFSLNLLEDMDPLSADDCPCLENKACIKVLKMDSFDAAIELDPYHNVRKHLGMLRSGSASPKMDTEPESSNTYDNSDTPTDESIKRILCEIHMNDSEPRELSKHEDVQKTNDSSDNFEPHTVQKEASVKGGLDLNDVHTKQKQPAYSYNLNHNRPVAVLNLASERSPGGGWQKGALAQEECLCYRSSLYLSLSETIYPLPSLAAIHSPNVLLIRDSMTNGHFLLTPQSPYDLPTVSVISAAALRKPTLSDDGLSFKHAGARAVTKKKIRLVLRVAANKGHTKLVLGALGCGVFANPPKEVAQCFLEVFQEPEFQGGWWEEVVFAVLDNVKGADGGKDGKGNFGQFYQVLHGLEV